MSEQTDVVNTEVDSTTISTSEGDVSQDANNKTDPSTVQTTTDNDESSDFLDAVKKGVEAVNKDETELKVSDSVDAEKDEQPEEQGPVPYERFSEVVSKRKELEQVVESQREAVDAQNSIFEFCNQHNITNDEFGYWLNVMAAVKNQPEKAGELLQPYLKQIKEVTGEVLSPELQTAVDNGEITPAYAKKLMVAEGQTKRQQQQSEMSAKQMQAHQQQQFVKEVQSSFMNWTKTKQASDPGFKAKVSEDAPDGKYEFFLHKVTAEYVKAGVKTSQDLIEFADKVYQSINKTFVKLGARPNGQKVVRSGQSTLSAQNTEPKTMMEAVRMGAAKASTFAGR